MGSFTLIPERLSPGQAAAAAKVLEAMRAGYPDLPENEQCHGAPFRKAANQLADLALASLAEEVAGGVAVVNWPAATTFAGALAAHDLGQYHVHFHRDPVALTTVIDLVWGALPAARQPVLIVEPILASGNTITAVLDHLATQGVEEKDVRVLCLLAARSGAERLLEERPNLRIFAMAADPDVDESGYIVPGLGDFFNKYSHELSSEEEAELDEAMRLPDDLRAMLHSYFRKSSLHDELRLLVVRDRQDAVVAERMHRELADAGLEPKNPGKRLAIDTGRVIGVEAVVGLIRRELESLPPRCLIAIEGVSGVGKSSTTKHLQKSIGAASFSLGEVFRYLAYSQKERGERPEDVLARASYAVGREGLELYDGRLNVSVELARELREPEIERLVPAVAAGTQAAVVGFVAEWLETMRAQLEQPMIIEGRPYTLDFLPSDLRITLTADPVVRAERRSGSA